jgi:hypothetical protein
MEKRKWEKKRVKLVSGASGLLTTSEIGVLVLLLRGPLGITPASALRVDPCVLRAHTWTELWIELLKGRGLGLGDHARGYHATVLGIWTRLTVRATLSLLLALCKDGLLNHLPADAFLDFFLLPLASLDGAY